MSFRFENDRGDEYWLAAHKWTMTRWLAEQFGWQPAGTEPPDDWDPEDGQGWRGEYDTNDGQIVPVADASNLADALDAALASPRFEDYVEAIQREYSSMLKDASTPNIELTLESASAGAWRERLVEMIAFCRNGGFRIH